MGGLRCLCLTSCVCLFSICRNTQTADLDDKIRYAEMDKVEKNKISHRGRALEKLQAWFAEQTSS